MIQILFSKVARDVIYTSSAPTSNVTSSDQYTLFQSLPWCFSSEYYTFYQYLCSGFKYSFLQGLYFDLPAVLKILRTIFWLSYFMNLLGVSRAWRITFVSQFIARKSAWSSLVSWCVLPCHPCKIQVLPCLEASSSNKPQANVAMNFQSLWLCMGGLRTLLAILWLLLSCRLLMRNMLSMCWDRLSTMHVY